tara:strand:- start:424 stop:1068 length:645 start_codon:yes stop_codon:yes gene_type:complete
MSKIKQVDYGHINWGPYVMRTKLPDYIIKRLLKDGDKLRKKDSYNYKLAGHLNNQFLYSIETQNWFYKEIHPIINAYREGHCKFHGIKNLPVELSFDDLWINYMKAGDFNPAHTHGGDYSFVLFADVPKKLIQEQEKFEGTSAKPGMLMFEFTQQARPRWSTTGVNVKPNPGDFFMFPALLQHWVVPFKSKITRISVSGNMRIENKDKLPHDYF